MENIWFIIAVGASIALGLQGFINKVIVEKGHPRHLSIFVYYLVQIPFFVIAWIALGSDVSWKLTLIGIIFGAQNYFLVRTIFIALANIPTSLYFIASRITLSLALLAIGLLFFGDSISTMEYIGFFIGFFVFALLIEKSKMTETNYRIGLYALAASILLMILGHSIVKYTAHRVDNIFYLHTIVSITGALLAYKFARPTISFSYPNIKEIVSWGALYGLLYGLTINFVYAAYRGNDLAITFKVLSYSLIVSIILSGLVYKERFTSKKVLAIILTAISLWFFF